MTNRTSLQGQVLAQFTQDGAARDGGVFAAVPHDVEVLDGYGTGLVAGSDAVMVLCLDASGDYGER